MKNTAEEIAEKQQQQISEYVKYIKLQMFLRRKYGLHSFVL